MKSPLTVRLVPDLVVAARACVVVVFGDDGREFSRHEHATTGGAEQCARHVNIKWPGARAEVWKRGAANTAGHGGAVLEASGSALTSAQESLLRRLRCEGGEHVYGADVRVAQRLEKLGLATLVDDGARGRGNADRERWWAEALTPPTPLGEGTVNP